MDIIPFINEIKTELTTTLPGRKAQFKMAPYERILQAAVLKRISKPKKSAVLVLLYPKEEKIHIVLILRNTYKGVHSAQVSFPGGKKDKTDLNLKETALREAEEEIGINKKDITIIGELTDLYIPPSGYLVQPYVGYATYTPDFKGDTKEVDTIIEVPLELFLDDSIIGKKKIKVSALNRRISYPFFNVKEHTVWGATAMMISEFREILKNVNPII